MQYENLSQNITCLRLIDTLICLQVTVVFPDVYPIPISLIEMCDTFLYYRIEKFPVHCLIEKEFLLTFVQKGSLIAKPLFQWSDVDQHVELDCSGKLKLSVNKDLYQELGLNGVPCLTLGTIPAKYCKIFMYVREVKQINDFLILYSNYNWFDKPQISTWLQLL